MQNYDSLVYLKYESLVLTKLLHSACEKYIVLMSQSHSACITLLQSLPQFSDLHWSHSSGQSTATQQVTGRTEVSVEQYMMLV